MATTTNEQTVRGGAWLIEETDRAQVTTPETLSDEHRLIAQTAAEFVDQEVLPAAARLEQKDWALNRQLLARCGALGLLGTHVPEAYGGVDLDKVAALLVSEQMARYPSWAATFGAQVNLTILPIALFGTDAQKAAYLPRLVAGEIAGAYCLSEPESGSDALGARSRAVRQADGSLRLTGEKTWITNGGFADLYVVFAKVDGEHFTAFLVERAWPGVSTGKEEHKLGLHGSSTTPVILQEVPVPASAVLGEIGKGHKVAFNVLNFGRFKLGAMCSGAGRAVIAEAAQYAAARRQFGVPIGTFGAIKHKLGEMTARQYALEALMYRTAGLIDRRVAAAPDGEAGRSAAMLRALEEFAVEASIAKVFGSEVLDYLVDENVQIHGGNGFVRDYPAEGHYRDARVNRIFEGTNEINRLLIPGMLMKRALKGDLPLVAAARRLQDEILSPPPLPAEETGAPMGEERRGAAALKKVALLVAGSAMQRFGAAIEAEQEVLGDLADLVIEAYAAESAVLRALDAGARALPAASLHADAAAAYVHEAIGRAELAARRALAAAVEGDALRTQLAALRRLLRIVPANTVAMRRRLADATLAARRYVLFG